jgi:hypothetical protein
VTICEFPRDRRLSLPPARSLLLRDPNALSC